MCSILGYYNTKLTHNDIEKLNLLSYNRGPDNSTVKEYNFLNKNLYLGHNRLSIQDLQAHANQPMENESLVIVFNGEVYNHLEIRKNLKFKNFLTSSDTETILWAFTELGIDAVKLFIGMFAISIYDKRQQKLYLLRDRVGIKPLYWTYQNNEFVFASELKGFSSHLKSNINNQSLVKFMSLGYIPNDLSYYEKINKLKPAHYLVFDGNSVDIKRYWDLPDKKIDISFDEALIQTEELIKSSIKYRLLSDLEVGSFLSGGVDSSLVSALMQNQSSSNIKTFSIGFEDKNYDESVYAKEVAAYLGSDHYEYKFGSKDVLALIEDFDKYYDEPFGDASSLPMMLLSKMTKDHVTVALSGDGGDELFLGYERYFLVKSYYEKFSKIPSLGRNFLSYLCQYSNIDRLEKISYPLKNLSLQNLYAVLNTSVKPWDLNTFFNKDFYYEVMKKEHSFLELQGIEIPFETVGDFSKFDFYRYLSDDILTKVDRASMAYSLEARVPLLDHRVVEFAYSLSDDLKLNKGKKSILKEILYKHVPKELIDRPKRGFSVPLKFWFRNELKDIVWDKIDSLDDNVFNKSFLKKLFNDHLKGKNYEYIFWNILRLKV